METAAHPRFLFRPRTLGTIFVTLTSSASLWTGVVKTFRYPPSVVPMDAREFFLTELRNFCRYESLRAEFDGFTWDDNTFLRTAIIRAQQGDATAWTDFTQRLLSRPKWAASVRRRLESWGYLLLRLCK